MADYKVVDAAKLDADLGAVADAIRDRAGTTEPLSFPDGMATAVAEIPDLLALRAGNTNFTEYESDEITSVRNYTFAASSRLVSLSLPNATRLNYYCCRDCTALVNVNIPKVTYLDSNVFASCSALQRIDLPSTTTISNSAFSGTAMECLILRVNSVCSLSNTGAFNSTPIASGTGYIYVPSALVDSYKTATNWSTYADQIRAIEDYPEITGGATI